MNKQAVSQRVLQNSKQIDFDFSDIAKDLIK